MIIEKFGYSIQLARLKYADLFHGVREKYLFSNGHRFSYFEINRGHPETIVYLHGLSDYKATALESLVCLSKRFNIIAPDLPYHGHTEMCDGFSKSISSFSLALNSFVQELGVGKVHLAGNSLGGILAFYMASFESDRYKSLSLIDTAGVFRLKVQSFYQDYLTGKNVFDVDTQEQFEIFLDTIFHERPYIPYPLKRYLHRIHQANSSLVLEVLDSMFNGVAKLDEAKTLREFMIDTKIKDLSIKVNILWGENDQIFPVELGYALHEELPEASFHLFKETGHCPQLERPREFSNALIEMLS